MIRNIIFDFGAVLVDWNPRYLYEPYFGDPEKTEHFLTEICPYSWNVFVDGGKPTAEATAERIALYPEWEKEIRMYYGQWIKMMGGVLPGMEELLSELKALGYPLWGLTNWSRETFPLVREKYSIFSLLSGIVVSGEEQLLKPQPEIYRRLLKRYSLNPSECLFIDDNPANVAGGEALGIKGIVFESAAQLREALNSALPELSRKL